MLARGGGMGWVGLRGRRRGEGYCIELWLSCGAGVCVGWGLWGADVEEGG